MILSFASDAAEYEVTIGPDEVLWQRRWRGEDFSDRASLSEAFLGGFWRLSAPPAVAFAGHRALAELIDPGGLPSPLARDRVRFVRRYDPARAAPQDLSWVRQEKDKPDLLIDLALVPEGLWGASPAHSFNLRTFLMPDEAFFLGPIEYGMPLARRLLLLDSLRSALAPGDLFETGDGFPLLDHERIERRDWTWNQQSNGSEDAVVVGPCCSVGYQFAQDYGYGEWSVERGATDITRVAMTAPAEIQAAIVAHILAARMG